MLLIPCLSACFLIIVDITGACGKSLLPGIPHCFATLVQAFLILSGNSQQVIPTSAILTTLRLHGYNFNFEIR